MIFDDLDGCGNPLALEFLVISVGNRITLLFHEGAVLDVEAPDYKSCLVAVMLASPLDAEVEDILPVADDLYAPSFALINRKLLLVELLLELDGLTSRVLIAIPRVT